MKSSLLSHLLLKERDGFSIKVISCHLEELVNSSNRGTKEAKHSKINNGNTNNSSSGAESQVPNSKSKSSNEVSPSEITSKSRVNESSDKDQNHDRSDLFKEIVVDSLSGIEEEPVLVAELFSVSAAAHVGVTAFGDLFTESVPVLFSIMLFEEFWGEHLASLAANSEETDENALNSDAGNGRESECDV